MLSAPTLIAGYQSLAISHRVKIIRLDAKPGEKIDIHGPTPSRSVTFVAVLETKMIFNLSYEICSLISKHAQP